MKWLRMSMLSSISGKGLARVLKKMTYRRSSWFFGELPYQKDLNVHHSNDVIHVKKNVCENLLETLLNTDRKIRDHGHAWADLKKMGIRPVLWLDDLVKGMELPTSCIGLSKHNKKEFCWFSKNVKVPSGYSMNVSRILSLLDPKVALSVKSHD
jgi:hypothetical protein